MYNIYIYIYLYIYIIYIYQDNILNISYIYIFEIKDSLYKGYIWCPEMN